MTSEQPTAHRETPLASPTSTPAFTPLSKPEPWLSPQVSSYFIAGGIAGAASRTVVSPLERLKIIQCDPALFPLSVPDVRRSDIFCRQIQPRNTGRQYTGVWRSLVRMWKEEGFKGFMRGNGINCVRIIPYSAVQFTTYEQLKKVCPFHCGGCRRWMTHFFFSQWFTSNGKRQLDTPTRLTSGALAGITSVCASRPICYPNPVF